MARAATLADQCETTMFIDGCGLRSADRALRTTRPFPSEQVEQHPEHQPDDRHVVPYGGEGAQVGLEPLDGERLGEGRWLLDEVDGREGPGPHEEDFQPDHYRQDDR